MPHWVDTDYFTPAVRASGTASAQPYVMSAGLSYRDYDSLIEAMRRLPDIPCRIRAGSYWVRGVVNRCGLPPNVQVESALPLAELRSEYAASRFAVVPIRHTTQWSAGSTAVLEAQAMGLPVIASATPGMPDYVRDGETGVLVEPHNPASLARAIRDLWEDHERVHALGVRGRQWVEDTFSLDRWLARFNDDLNAS
jgi:glycosyltransferase involved in cell wall biosynthesis